MMNVKAKLSVLLLGVLALSACNDGGPAAGPGSAAPATVTLSVSLTPSTDGLVTSSPSGISCGAGPLGGTCSATFAGGSVVTLTATPIPDRAFVGWSGVCSAVGTAACTLTLNSNVSTVASFSPNATLGDTIALTDANTLVSFNRVAPEMVRTRRPVAPLATGEKLLAIDYRPTSLGPVLYGVTSNGRLLILNPATGAATGAIQLTIVDPASTATPPARINLSFPANAVVGMDFNPQADALRLVTGTGENYRIPGANLLATAATAGQAVTDSALRNSAGTPVTGSFSAGYTNNFLAAKGTLLYLVDTQTDKLFLQDPPNAGTLNEVGSLGVAATGVAGFDISGTNLDAVTILTVAGSPRLYSIDLRSGQAGLLGSVGVQTGETLRDLAIPAIATAPANGDAYALTGSNRLFKFNRATPASVLSTHAVLGLVTQTEKLVGMDFRPTNDTLYALSDSGNLYTLNPVTGLAKLYAALTVDTADTTAPYAGLTGTAFGFDFNPVADSATPVVPSLRITSNTGQNLRVQLVDGSPNQALVTTDTNLNRGTGTTFTPVATGISATGYLNAVRDAGTTLLLGIDTDTDNLVNISTVTGNEQGRVSNVGSLTVNADGVNGFDIDGYSGTFYALLTVSGSTGLYTIGANGQANLVGNLAGGTEAVTGFALIQPARAVLYGLAASGTSLVRFDAGLASATTLPITGLGSSEQLIGIDFRASDNRLYGVTANARVYRLTLTTNTAGQVVSAVADQPAVMTASQNDSTNQFAGAFTATAGFGLDFNPTFAPTSAAIRITSSAAENIATSVAGETVTDDTLVRPEAESEIPSSPLDPLTGILLGVVGLIGEESGLPVGGGGDDCASGGNSSAVSAAYANNFANALATTLYVLDSSVGCVYTANVANGSLAVIGPVGVAISGESGFDIAGGHNGLAFAVSDTDAGSANSALVRIVLAAGTTARGTEVNVVPANTKLRGLAIQLLPPVAN